MNRRDVLSELRNLELPTDGYIVLGGAAVVARGLRDTNDSDIEAYLDVNFGELERSTPWLLAHAERIDEVPVIAWQTLIYGSTASL